MTDRPLLDTLADMTAASLSRANLPDRELMLVRLAGLIAVDAPPSSYLLNIGPAMDSGLTLEDAQTRARRPRPHHRRTASPRRGREHR